MSAFKEKKTEANNTQVKVRIILHAVNKYCRKCAELLHFF